MTEVLLTVAVSCYCAVWLIMQYVLTVRKRFNPWWAFNAAVLWPVTFALALSGYNFNIFRETRER